MNELPFDLSQLQMERISLPANRAQLIELENHFDHPIPMYLKELFKNYNGGSPKLNQSGTFHRFYVLGKNRKDPFNVWYVINTFGKILGSETLPFAERQDRAIYFLKWEHIQAKVYVLKVVGSVEEMALNPQIELICPSFNEFLTQLPKVSC